MKIILKSCAIVSPDYAITDRHDVLIENGIIQHIAAAIETDDADHIITQDDLHISAGWFDAKVNFCDPGNEVKEDLNSGLKAAEAGGMTEVAITPNTTPVIANKSQIEYLKSKSAFSPVKIHPYACLTAAMEGNNLAELYDLSTAGAIGFTDVKNTVSGGIMYRALLYAKNFNGRIISFPLDNSIFGEGIVHEGKASVLTGLKAIPSLAESMLVERDLNLVRYTEGCLHFTGISTKESVALIRQAKAEGLAVTADVYVHNLVYTDENILDFDSVFKVLPPLRGKDDQEALIEGLKDGTIDFVCSDHTPEDLENKDVEFDHAAFGMIGTQTLFPLLNSVTELTLEERITLISQGPRTVFGLPLPAIKIGEVANLTLFSPTASAVITSDNLLSKSKNTPLLNKTVAGKVIGIINKGILSLNQT